MAPDDGLSCSKCGYDLTSLEHFGKCPECGTFVSYSKIVRSIKPKPTTHLWYVNLTACWLISLFWLARRRTGPVPVSIAVLLICLIIAMPAIGLSEILKIVRGPPSGKNMALLVCATLANTSVIVLLIWSVTSCC